MSNWKARLREADEALARVLSAEDAQRLRRTVLAGTSAGARARQSLSFHLLAGSLAAVSAALVLSTMMASPGPARSTDGNRSAAAGDASAEGRQNDNGLRQLQFATPGGTRIIWVFDSEFEVKGTLP